MTPDHSTTARIRQYLDAVSAFEAPNPTGENEEALEAAWFAAKGALMASQPKTLAEALARFTALMAVSERIDREEWPPSPETVAARFEEVSVEGLRFYSDFLRDLIRLSASDPIAAEALSPPHPFRAHRAPG